MYYNQTQDSWKSHGCMCLSRHKMTGRNFDLSSRLPITLMMMAVAVTFSPALPVLFPMVSVYLIITYFGDKFHLLRSCCTPPQVLPPKALRMFTVFTEEIGHKKRAS